MHVKIVQRCVTLTHFHMFRMKMFEGDGNISWLQTFDLSATHHIIKTLMLK